MQYINPIVNIKLDWKEARPLRIGVRLEREDGSITPQIYTGDDAREVLTGVYTAIDRLEAVA